MDDILQLNEFFVEGGDQKKSHVLLHLSEPSTPEEKLKGYFFAICEIDRADTKQIARLQNIIDELENGYYELPSTEDKNALENIVEQVNQQSYVLAKAEIELHCIVGAVHQPHLVFTTAGKPHLVLFYKNRQGMYQRLNLLETEHDQSTPSEEPVRPQLFSHIIQGKLSPGDFLFAGTPHLGDYFTHDRLQKIITTRPARQSADHLERVLGELHDGVSFGGLVMHLNPSAELASIPKRLRPSALSSEHSLTNLFTTEQNTAHTLDASLFPQLRNKLQQAFSGFTTSKKKPTPVANLASPQAPSLPPEINSAHLQPHRSSAKTAAANAKAHWGRTVTAVVTLLLKTSLHGFIWAVLALWTLLKSTLRGIVMLFFVTTNLQHRRQTILEDWGRQWHGFKEHVYSLPLTTKLAALSALVLAVAFVGSLLYMRHAQATREAVQQYQDTVAFITAKTTAADSALLYQNSDAAWAEINAAEDKLKTLSCKSKEEKTTCQKFNNELTAILTKLRKIVVVEPIALADWSDTPNTTLAELARVNSSFVAISASSANIYVYDLLTKEKRMIAGNFPINTISSITVPKENDYVLLVGPTAIWQLNPRDFTLKKIDVTFPSKNASLTGAVVYNRRLYSLDTGGNQIYKHDKIKTGFGLGKIWLKDSSVLLSDGVDLTSDGDLFVSKSDGTILKLTAGLVQPFPITGLDPKLNSGAKLWTYTDLAYLYILDPAERRLIILEKDGRLKAQLTATAWKHPAGLVVDEPNRTAYITDGSKLYKITLPQ